MIPDVEALVGSYLREQPAVKTLKARVVGMPPDDKTKPWVRVTQLDAPAVGRHRSDHLIEWFGQLDCYAGATGGQGEASLLTRTVRERLAAMPTASFDDAVVTGVEFVSCPRIPDSDVAEPARERYALSVIVYLHGK